MKLTRAQRSMIETLREANEIHYGVIWYIKYTYRDKPKMKAVDGRVCNALVRTGVLKPTEQDPHRYTLENA